MPVQYVEVHIGGLTRHWQANTLTKSLGVEVTSTAQIEAIHFTGHRCTDLHSVTHLYNVFVDVLFRTNSRVYLVISTRFGQLFFHAASLIFLQFCSQPDKSSRVVL